MRFVVLFDACVLYPAPLRDLMLNLALTDLFAARWTVAYLNRRLLGHRPHAAQVMVDDHDHAKALRLGVSLQEGRILAGRRMVSLVVSMAMRIQHG